MPKAEVGSTKHLANKMKAKGLQRLRWYCQICGKQCRDENGFKQHTQSEGHVRAMLLVGEDPRKYIEDYSKQFLRDFTRLLKTSHGEKKVSLNGFYQEYIRDKEHIHMNATKWGSLTEFAKHLGKEGICRVEEGDRGIEVAFVDDSPEAVRRREDVKRRDKLAKGDEDLEARLLERQIKAAEEEAARRVVVEEKKERKEGEEMTAEPIKISMSLGGSKATTKRTTNVRDAAADAAVEISTFSSTDAGKQQPASIPADANKKDYDEDEPAAAASAVSTPKVSLSLGTKKKHVNPLMAKKRSDPLSKKSSAPAPMISEKKMSNAERIMLEEIERKRKVDERAAGGGKRQRI
jgi:DNA/RNA-binding protein KIN17